MREFFRFSHVQLTQTGPADDFGQGGADFGWCKGHRQILKLFVIQGEDHEGEVLQILAGKMAELPLGEGFGELYFALAAPAAENNRISIPHQPHRLAGFIRQYQRLKRIISLPFSIQSLGCRSQRQSAVTTFCLFHIRLHSINSTDARPGHSPFTP